MSRGCIAFRCAVVAAAVVPTALWSFAATGQAVPDFYRDRTVTLVVAADAAGGYAAYARPVAEQLATRIPGVPTVIVQFMQGAGGMNAANYLYNVAPKDGSYIGMPLSTLVLNHVLGRKGVRYDAAKFNWLGTVTTLSEVIAVWHTAPVKTFEEARRTEIIIGAVNKGSQTYLVPKLASALLGARFRIVTGYRGGDENLGLERGEFHGRLSAWQSWQATRPDWIRDGKIVVLLQSGVDPIPELPNVPRFIDLAQTPEDKMLVKLLEAGSAIGRSLLAPPDVPAERVAALRTALAATLRDPALLADAEKRKLTIVPGSGERLQSLLAEVAATPPAVVTRFKTLVEFDG